MLRRSGKSLIKFLHHLIYFGTGQYHLWCEFVHCTTEEVMLVLKFHPKCCECIFYCGECIIRFLEGLFILVIDIRLQQLTDTDLLQCFNLRKETMQCCNGFILKGAHLSSCPGTTALTRTNGTQKSKRKHYELICSANSKDHLRPANIA